MNVLIACEESQRVCISFREKGHVAYSCDILECSGGYPEWHILGDALSVIDGKCLFYTQDGLLHEISTNWDLIIAHPPCTYLAVSGAGWNNTQRYGVLAIERIKKQKEAIDFFLKIARCECDKIAIENPVGVISTAWRRPDQYIQPYQYGEHARKKTGLWLKNLPLLKPTNIVDPGLIIGNYSVNAGAFGCRDKNGKMLRWNDPETAKQRSKTFWGIARAMADQWGGEA